MRHAVPPSTAARSTAPYGARASSTASVQRSCDPSTVTSGQSLPNMHRSGPKTRSAWSRNGRTVAAVQPGPASLTRPESLQTTFGRRRERGKIDAPRVEPSPADVGLAQMIEHDGDVRTGPREVGQGRELLVDDAGVERQVVRREPLDPRDQLGPRQERHRLGLQQPAHTHHERVLHEHVEVWAERVDPLERREGDDAADSRVLGGQRAEPRDFIERLLVPAIGLDDDHRLGTLQLRREVRTVEPRVRGEPCVISRARIPEVHVRVEEAQAASRQTAPSG